MVVYVVIVWLGSCLCSGEEVCWMVHTYYIHVSCITDTV